MAEFPFWDDVCLRGSIDRTPLPAPSRSLFENDLFCSETDLENQSLEPFSDLLPTLSASPSTSALCAAEQALALNIDKNDDDQPSNSAASLCPLRMGAHTLVPPPASITPFIEVPSTPIFPELPACQITPRSPGNRAWRSFLDENCPLRRRVKVTIVPSARKRERETPSQPPPAAASLSPSLKKPRHSQMRVSAPRRTQTTFRVPRPGDSAARITLDVRSPPVKRTLNISPHAGPSPKRRRSPIPDDDGQEAVLNKLMIDTLPVVHSNNSDDGFIDGVDDFDRQILLEPDLEIDSEPLPMDDQSQDFILSLESGPSDSMAHAPGSLVPEPMVLPKLKPEFVAKSELELEPAPVAQSLPARKRHPYKGTSSLTPGIVRAVRDNRGIGTRSFITTSLQHRLSTMAGTRPSKLSSNQSPRACTALPLVDAAVQAVARAARDYSDMLSCSFPVAASAAATIAMCHPQSCTVPKKRRTVRRRRVLLSFDDADVKPLVTDENPISTESVLTGFLNCPSPCKKKVST